jgi:enoyl-CoA hydratase
MPLIKTEHPDFLTVSISRPAALNALNLETLSELRELLQEIYQSPKIRGLILTGDGDKAFVAGADIQELAKLNPTEMLELSQKGQELFFLIEHCPKPVIAAVNGYALGGGCELAMACHIRIATASSKFGQPEVNLGTIPGYGGTQRLSQLVGRGKALELMLTADLIGAEEAKSLGLVNHVVPSKDELLSFAQGMMEKILTKSSIAIGRVIESVNAGFSFETAGYSAEAHNFSACAATEDFKEGTSAFLQKRKPQFKNK